MTTTIRLEYDENIREKIAELPETIYLSTLQVLRERLELMVGLAKIYVLVDTGSLRDSIRMQWIGAGRRVATVRAGGYITNPKTGRLVDYAVYVEAKQPFMSRAWDEVKADVEQLIADRVVQRVSE